MCKCLYITHQLFIYKMSDEKKKIPEREINESSKNSKKISLKKCKWACGTIKRIEGVTC